MPMITVSISPQLAAQIQAAVDEGVYASSSEVVRDALHLWGDVRRRPPPRAVAPSILRIGARQPSEEERMCVADLFDAHEAGRAKTASRIRPSAASSKFHRNFTFGKDFLDELP